MLNNHYIIIEFNWTKMCKKLIDMDLLSISLCSSSSVFLRTSFLSSRILSRSVIFSVWLSIWSDNTATYLNHLSQAHSSILIKDIVVHRQCLLVVNQWTKTVTSFLEDSEVRQHRYLEAVIWTTTVTSFIVDSVFRRHCHLVNDNWTKTWNILFRGFSGL